MPETFTENADGSVVTITGRTLYPWTLKINPLWWLVGPDGWTVPDVNNGEPYLPDVTNVWLRRFYWFFCRNPLMNFVGYVVGFNDRNYTIVGSPHLLANTGRDTTPTVHGWRWAVLKIGFLRFPFVNYFDGKLEFYFGWRPSGGFGLKFVFRSQET